MFQYSQAHRSTLLGSTARVDEDRQSSFDFLVWTARKDRRYVVD